MSPNFTGPKAVFVNGRTLTAYNKPAPRAFHWFAPMSPGRYHSRTSRAPQKGHGVTKTHPNASLRRLPFTLFAGIAIALLVIAACGDDDDDSDDGSPTTSAEATDDDGGTPDGTSTPEGTLEPPEECTAGEGQQGLLSDLIFDHDDRQYAVGEEVEMTLRLTNCGENEATLHYVTGQRYEFIIANSETGEELWRWSDGQAFTEALDEQVLANGEVVEYTETWDQTNSAGEQVPEGRYKVSAFSVGCGVPSEEPCQFGPIRQIDIGTETEQVTVPPTEPS